MPVIDLMGRKNEIIRKENEEFRINCYDKACYCMAQNELDLGIKVMEQGLNKYANLNIKNKCNAYRNICLAYEIKEEIDNMMIYVKKLEEIVEVQEKNLYEEHPDVYIMSVNKIMECRKSNMDKRKQIQINKRLLQCAKENNFKIDELVARTSIDFLRERYNEIIQTLSDLHNNKYNFTEEDNKFLIREISKELKDNNIKFYQKYKNDISLNNAISL